MTTQTEALELALEALQNTYALRDDVIEAITAIKEALAQPEQGEPVECQYGNGGYACCEGGPCKADEQNNALFKQEHGEPVAWRNAAIRVGEDLCSVGPFGYYDMTAKQWLDWALSVVTVHLPPQQRKPLTDEQILSVARDHYNPHQRHEISFARAIEAAHGIKE
jgi:hypothetical protein